MTGTPAPPPPPPECPRGHDLTGERTVVTVRITCSCPGAQAAGTTGHTICTCRQCILEDVDTAYFDPLHQPEQEPRDNPATRIGQWRITPRRSFLLESEPRELIFRGQVWAQ